MKYALLLAMLLMTMVGVTGCGETTETGKETNEIHIGVVLPLSGDLKEYGENVKRGIDLRVKQVNATGGIDGKKIILHIEDNKGDADTTEKALAKLIGTDKVSAILGPITSGNSLRAKATVKKYKVPLITPTATNEDVTKNNKYMFRTCFTDAFQGQVIAEYLRKEKNFNSAGVFIESGSAYSEGLSASFALNFEALGGGKVFQQSYKKKDTKFDIQLAKIAESGAETVLIPGYPGELVPIIRSAQNLSATLAGADGWDNDKILTETTDRVVGSYFVGAIATNEERPMVQEFVKAYVAEHDSEPGTFEALGYDSVVLLESAVKQGGTDRAKITEALSKTKNLELVTGQLTVDATGESIKSAAVLEIVKDTEGTIGKKLVRWYHPE